MAQYIVAVISTAERKCVKLDFPDTEEDLIRLAGVHATAYGEGHVVITHPSETALELEAFRRRSEISYEARMQLEMLRLTHPHLGLVSAAG